MDLCITTLNPAPPGGIVSFIKTADGVGLRVARWRCEGRSAGTVAIFPGRAEFIEKYFEVAAQLLDRNLDVVVLDWRGQGGSDRLTRNRSKGHVDHFSAYQRDLEALTREILEPLGRAPFFALGHSMAGPILLDQASCGRSAFERIVLTAPMIDLHRSPFAKFAHSLVPILAAMGLGRIFAPGHGGATPYLARAFEGNLLTSDPARYARVASVIAAAPERAIGGPTIGWANEAFAQMRRVAAAGFARRIMAPVLIVAAGLDQVVDTRAAEAFAAQLKRGRYVTIASARHEIHIENDDVRTQFWTAFDAFIPGSTAAAGLFAASSG